VPLGGHGELVYVDELELVEALREDVSTYRVVTICSAQPRNHDEEEQSDGCNREGDSGGWPRTSGVYRI
jgi:hypothetical protein